MTNVRGKIMMNVYMRMVHVNFFMNVTVKKGNLHIKSNHLQVMSNNHVEDGASRLKANHMSNYTGIFKSWFF
jgi:hypothetical protein